jgi:hypothetical protein
MNALRLSTLDFLINVADSRTRPLDFALILRLRNPLSTQACKVGAHSARLMFPTTRSQVRDRGWLPVEECGGVRIKSIHDDGASVSEIERFLERPFDPARSLPVAQLLITNGEDETRNLVTRFHHVAADGLSAAMWLSHQLRVAYGLEEPAIESAGDGLLELRHHSAPVKRSIFAFPRRSERLWNRCGHPSHQRRWTTFQLDAAALRQRCRKAGGFTYNDLLATCLLEVLVRWNSEHGTTNPRSISLWFPVNVRATPTAGFGNGTSRIRIYSCYEASSSLADKCRMVRRQVRWSIRNGEWFVPSKQVLAHWPLWAIKPMLRGYLSRPSVDMGTSVFSHVEQLGSVDDPVFQNIERIECVGLLHKSHCLAVNGVTLHGQTSLTFTYDPSLLTQADIKSLAGLYQEQIALALREI